MEQMEQRFSYILKVEFFDGPETHLFWEGSSTGAGQSKATRMASGNVLPAQDLDGIDENWKCRYTLFMFLGRIFFFFFF